MFPTHSLDGVDKKDSEQIRAIDDWISNTLIPSRFREAVDWTDSWGCIQNGWTLARVVSDGLDPPLPW